MRRDSFFFAHFFFFRAAFRLNVVSTLSRDTQGCARPQCQTFGRSGVDRRWHRSARARQCLKALPPPPPERPALSVCPAVCNAQVASLQKSQAARILLGALRSSRRSLLASAMNAWRSATARRVQAGMHVQSLALRTAHRQRKFFLGKAWSRIVSAGAGREAARARQVCVWSLCSSNSFLEKSGRAHASLG